MRIGLRFRWRGPTSVSPPKSAVCTGMQIGIPENQSDLNCVSCEKASSTDQNTAAARIFV